MSSSSSSSAAFSSSSCVLQDSQLFLNVHGSTSQITSSKETPRFLDGGVEGLAYLIQFQNSSDFCPFTREQEAIFLTSRKWEKINNKLLKIGLAGCTLLSVAPALLGLNVIQNWQNSSNNTSTMFIVVTLYAGAIGMINYVCTGTVPDKAASTANENATNAVPKARKTYEEIACNILKIYKEDSARAKLIAAKMNIENIQKAMSRFIPSSLGEDICLSLNFAVQAVLNDQIDEKAPSLIKLQWENIELNRKIDTLAQQMLRSI